MTILYDSALTVKPAAVFARGVAPARRRFEPTPEDQAWAAAEFARLESERYDAALEARAETAEHDRLYEAGVSY